MASASFTQHGHQYECDGRSIPSVMQALSLAGLTDVSRIPPHILQRAADIGTAVHLACAYLDADDLDLDSVDPKIVGYVLAYQKFRTDSGFTPELIEHRAVGIWSGLQYGFCVDRLGQLDGQRIVLDLKTSSKPYTSWPIQTVAYALGLDCFEARRAVIHLAKEGSYKLIEHPDRVHDAQIWESALAIAHWKLVHASGAERTRVCDKLNEGELTR